MKISERSGVLAITLFLAIVLFSCQDPGKNASGDQKIDYIGKGQEIIKASSAAMLERLTEAMSAGGVQNAVSYCNMNAINITDSLSLVYSVELRRTSDKYRNGSNIPDSAETAIIADFKARLAAGNELSPVLVENEGQNIKLYSPIIINNPMCLACHGEPGITLSAEDDAFIKTRFPDDLATGYKLGELRGLWVVTFLQGQVQ